LSYIQKLRFQNNVQTGRSTQKKNDDQEAVIERCTVHKEVISVK